VLLHKFADLLSDDFTTIIKHDPFPLPETIQLFNPNTNDELPQQPNDDDLQAMPQWSFNDDDADPAQVRDEVVQDDNNDPDDPPAFDNVHDSPLAIKLEAPDEVAADIEALHTDDTPMVNDEFVPYKDYETPNLPAEKDDKAEKAVKFKE
jgi:hypothetical protein